MTTDSVPSRAKSIFYDLTRVNEWWLIAFVLIIFAFVPHIFRQNYGISLELIIEMFTTLPLYIAILVIFSAQMFLFASNDFFDRHVDALDKKKRERNPVSAGRVSDRNVYVLFIVTASISLIFSFYFGFQAFLFTAFSLIVFFFYTAEPMRFKKRIGLDVITHGTLINTFPYFFCIVALPDFSRGAIFLLFVLMIRSSIAQILQEVRDYDIDRKVEKNTVVALGQKRAIWLVVGLYVMITLTTLALIVSTYLFGLGISPFNLIIFYMCMIYIPSFYELLNSKDYKVSIESLWLGRGRTQYRLGASFVGTFGLHLSIIYFFFP